MYGNSDGSDVYLKFKRPHIVIGEHINKRVTMAQMEQSISVEKRANIFACYYLVLFGPGKKNNSNNTQINLYSYNWEAAAEYTTWLKDEKNGTRQSNWN